MKRNSTLCILVFALLWWPQLLSAQRSDAFSTMKPGDWFEVLVSDTARTPNDESYRYNIRYLLKKYSRDGRKDYLITFERIRVIFAGKNAHLGYDSYYPPYKQGLLQKNVKPTFLSIVNKAGKVLSMKPAGNFPGMELKEISVRKSYGGSWAELAPVDSETSITISRLILGALARSERNWNNGQLYKDSGLSFLLSAASFPLQPNVVIEGQITNINERIRNNLNLYLLPTDRNFQIAKDGSFRRTVFLTQGTAFTLSYRSAWNKTNAIAFFPAEVDVRIPTREWNIPLYVRPGDTLHISADGRNLINTLKFSGKPASAAVLGLELAKSDQNKKTPEIPYFPTSFSARDFMQAQAADRTTFLKIIHASKNQLSNEVSQFHQLKFSFEQATARLDFLNKTNYLSSPDAVESFEGFPEKFFTTIDTLPVLMVDNTHDNWYNSFLSAFQLYNSWKSGKFNGGNDGFFLGDYVRSLNYLKLFPLYFALAEGFEKELYSKDWRDAQSLKPYYEGFIANCGDTLLTRSVQRKWQTLSAWAPGMPIPLKSIKLADGSLLDLSKFKGKALSITFNYHYPDEMRRLLDRIRKQDPKNVHFLIVQLKEDGYPKSGIADELKNLPQVTYAEVLRDNDIQNIVLLTNFDIKTFVFDGEQRVIEDNINDTPNALPKHKSFDEAIQKALLPKTMIKEDKAELTKTLGWSIGSILFAGLIFLWIYKARISTIKRKEALKRQIKELEIKAIRSQMNPHFMFNALNSIQSLINNHQYKEANVYLEKFSLLMRRVLNNSGKTFVSLSDELEAVSLYSELEKLRFDFVFIISLEEGINTELIEIPGMIIQPLVENAVLHGIAQKGSVGKLEIRISIEAKYLKIEVKDNGLGFEDNLEGVRKNGFGLKLVRERLNLMNEQGTDGNLNIRHNLGDNESGVTATLTIPID